MSATSLSMYSQNSTQGGSTLATAFPQVSGYAQNLDILQIASKKGNGVLASVDYLGNVSRGLTLTAVAVSGSNVTYTGTFANGGANAFVGRKIYVSGFAVAGNNGSFGFVTASTTTTITLVATSQSNETHAGKLTPYTAGHRLDRFVSNFAPTDTFTTAQLFADAFTNPAQQDIFQAVNIGGNAHYYLDYLGVAHGS